MKRIPHFHEKRGTNKSGVEWVAYYHVATIDGKAKWTSLGTNRVEALRKWADLEHKPTPAETGTFDAIAELYMEWFQKEVDRGENAQRTYDDRVKYIKSLKDIFKGKPMDAITSVVVTKYLDKRTAKISGKKEVVFLGTMWNWAKSRGHLKNANPVVGVEKPKERGRKMDVQPHEYWLAWECGDQMVRDTLELAARLGTRPQEVFSLEWKNIDLRVNPATVEIWQNKVKEWRTIQADDALTALLGRLRGDRDKPKGYVLTDEDGAQLKTTGAFRYRFDAARDLAEKKAAERGIEFRRFQHRDVRPMAGISTMQAEGMDAARRLLGHSTERMTAHYTTKRVGMVGKSSPLRSTSKTSQDITGEDSVSA